MGTEAMLRCQYEQLRVVEALDVPGLRTPNTFALLPAKRLLLIEFVAGEKNKKLSLGSEDIVPPPRFSGRTLAPPDMGRGGGTVPRPPVGCKNDPRTTA